MAKLFHGVLLEAVIP